MSVTLKDVSRPRIAFNEMLELLEQLNFKGGLGLDIHERVTNTIAYAKKYPQASVEQTNKQVVNKLCRGVVLSDPDIKCIQLYFANIDDFNEAERLLELTK